MGRGATQAHGTRPSVTHAGSLVFRYPCSPPCSSPEAWVLVDEDVVALSEWVRCKASLTLAPEIAAHMATRRRAVNYSLEQRVRRAMDGYQLRDVCVRLPFDVDTSTWMLSMRARCSVENAEHLREELALALKEAEASTRESLALQQYTTIAQTPTAGDLALSRSSLVRMIGMPIRNLQQGFFNATGWDEIGAYVSPEFRCGGPWYYHAWSPLDWEPDNSKDCASRPSRRQERRRLHAHDALRSRQCDASHGDVYRARVERSALGKLRSRERERGRESKQLERLVW